MQINIWQDNWVLGNHNIKIRTPRGNNILTIVDELIKPIDSTWDTDSWCSLSSGV